MGRSCILIESDDTRVLLDCGIKLGKIDEYPTIKDEEFQRIDGIVLSHAHLDHCGYLPHAFSAGYHGYVHTIKPTFELTNVMIADYMHISNPKNVTKEGLRLMQRHFKLFEYGEEFKIKNLTFKLLPAGHILGSAMIEVRDSMERLLYTGDMNMRSTRLLDPAYTEHLNANVLITESTYSGDADVFPGERVVLAGMLQSIKDTLSKGGKIIVPSLAVGRAEEVLFLLDDYMKSGVIPAVPIYIDGMINKAMRIYRHNVIYCRDELQKRILMSDDDPFKSKNFNPVTTKQQRSRIIRSKDPSIIVTTSGMLTGGPVIRYLEALGRDPNNKLLIVSYQAEGTRGRMLLDGARELPTDNGHKITVNLQVEQYHLSAHADRPALMSFIGKVNNLRTIFLIHGEITKLSEFAVSLKNKYKTIMPENNVQYTV